MPPRGTAVRPPAKKKKPRFNPIAFVTQSARKAWMWSAVKKAATKDYCEECGKTGVKLEIHHRVPVDVYGTVKKLMDRLIPATPDELDCLCTECHKASHRKDT